MLRAYAPVLDTVASNTISPDFSLADLDEMATVFSAEALTVAVVLAIADMLIIASRMTTSGNFRFIVSLFKGYYKKYYSYNDIAANIM